MNDPEIADDLSPVDAEQGEPTGESLLGSGYPAGTVEVSYLEPPPDNVGLGTPEMGAGGTSVMAGGEPSPVSDAADEPSAEIPPSQQGSVSAAILGCVAIFMLTLVVAAALKKGTNATTLAMAVSVGFLIGLVVARSEPRRLAS